MAKPLRVKRFCELLPMVVNVEFVGQLVDAMSEAVLKLERAIKRKKMDDVNRLRTFIFDLHRQIDVAIGVENVS